MRYRRCKYPLIEFYRTHFAPKIIWKNRKILLNLLEFKLLILILKTGMFVGVFPPGYYLSRCRGTYYNLKGEEEYGTFDIDIEDKERWGNDELGEYLPSY